ncbi:MAG: hypothetical protein V4719_14055 [Planctomycetota bacterium]
MIRFASCLLTVSLLLTEVASAETIALTRVNNGDQQIAKSRSFANVLINGPPNMLPDFGPNDDQMDDYSASSTSGAMTAYGADIGEATDYTDAVCNTAPTVTNFAPSVNVVTGGPMIITGTPTRVSARSSGDGTSDADFTVGNPINPTATLVLTGTITIAASSDTFTTTFSTSAQVGGSTITCTPTGCTGVIKDMSVPGGQYTVSSPASGGTWNFSEVVIKGSNIHMKAAASYTQEANNLCSDYPDFNVAAFMSVNAP